MRILGTPKMLCVARPVAGFAVWRHLRQPNSAVSEAAGLHLWSTAGAKYPPFWRQDRISGRTWPRRAELGDLCANLACDARDQRARVRHRPAGDPGQPAWLCVAMFALSQLRESIPLPAFRFV
jgi:hypothetical protein